MSLAVERPPSGASLADDALPLFPAFLNLAGRRVLLVGGGAVAAQKLAQLLPCGAHVRLIAPALGEDTRRLCAAHPAHIDHWPRTVEPDDLADVCLVITATNDAAVNASIVQEARRRGILANSVDDPPYCDFFAASTLDRGPVRIAISTQGGFPGLSAAVRKTLDALLGELLPQAHWADLSRLCALRSALKTRMRDAAARGALLKGVCADLEARYFGLSPRPQESLAP